MDRHAESVLADDRRHSREASLDQIFTDLLSALNKVNEILVGARTALLRIEEPSGRVGRREDAPS